jgi:hypothetical protein
VYPKDQDETSNKEKLHKKKQLFINRTNFSGFTALHLAAQNGHNQSLRELLYAGCSTSIQNDYGDSALHTSVRYGHAGVVRILISAKCDIDAFNLNHDTPLHISAAIGRRKLTKLLVEAGSMQFRNNQNETPRDIARRKNFCEIVQIIDTQSEKIDKKLVRESLRKSKNGTNQECLPHNKQKYNNFISPYGCHYYPNSRNFPHPKLQTLPKEPLQTGEIYYLDLAGNIRKGPIGASRNCACNCGQKSNEAMVEHCKNIQKYVDKANEKLNKKIHELTTKIEKTERKHHHQRERSNERDLDPLYPLLKIVGDKNKQIHLEKWLNKVHPDANDSQSDMRSSEIAIKEVPVDVHCVDIVQPRERPRETMKVSRSSSRRMPEYDENERKDAGIEMEHDDSYTDISDNDNNDEDDDDDASVTDSENPLYDESFIRKFQQQQFAQQNSYQNESLTSQSIASNQNIEMEMEKIAKSLMTMTSDDAAAVMINSRNPDVIKDIHVSHSAKRSTKKIKSAITKPILSSNDIYVNTFFNNDSSDGNHRQRYKNSQSDVDEVDSCEIDQLVSKVQQTIVGSNYAASSSPHLLHQHHHPHNGQTFWNRVGRSRNPIPMDITDEIDNYAENLFHNPPIEAEEEEDEEEIKEDQVQSTISENNFILLDKLLKARKHLNHNYHHQQQINGNGSSSIDENGNPFPSSSLV